jgi:hypothetical protein
MRFTSARVLISLSAALVVLALPSLAGADVTLPWQTGMAAVGNDATIEPAIDDTTGNQVFLLTPNGSPFFQGAPGQQPPPPFRNVSAPLYLVTYPMQSTVDVGAGADPLNCYTEGFFVHGLPYNCDHAQIPGIKGHDHLVGVPGSKKAGGDFNVQWHVLATFFTPQGIADGAMNTRITTLAQLQKAQADGDVTGFNDTGIYFDCNVVSAAVYRGATPLNFG